MKTYGDLTEKQQEAAVDFCVGKLLDRILEGALRFDDEASGDNLQKRIDAAIREADRLQTPWFAGECILETCGKDLRDMAAFDAENALYAEPGEFVIRMIDL